MTVRTVSKYLAFSPDHVTRFPSAMYYRGRRPWHRMLVLFTYRMHFDEAEPRIDIARRHTESREDNGSSCVANTSARDNELTMVHLVRTHARSCVYVLFLRRRTALHVVGAIVV
jgi:hypothetical protein